MKKHWLETNLKVSSFPSAEDISNSVYDYYINVSDEFKPDCYLSAVNSGKKYFWFPMNEMTSNIGINSIYGALQILWLAEKENAKVYLHCHAGINRSVTVRDAYYFLRMGFHREGSMDDFYYTRSNRLIGNCNNNCLPPLQKMESFLNKCRIAFSQEDGRRGFLLDKIFDTNSIDNFTQIVEWENKSFQD